MELVEELRELSEVTGFTICEEEPVCMAETACAVCCLLAGGT